MFKQPLILAVLLAASLGSLAHAQNVGGYVQLQDIDREGDLKAIAGSIEVTGRVGGDVALAGGSIDIDMIIAGDAQMAGGSLQAAGEVGGDAAFAGASVQINMNIGEDADLAGAHVTYSGTIGGDLESAASDFEFNPDAVLSGNARLTGREIELEGTIAGDLEAFAEEITLAGRIDGDVSIEAQRLYILETAVIGGSIEYTGPREPEVAAGAQLASAVDFTQGDVSFEWDEDVEDFRRLASLIESAIPPAEFFILVLGGFAFLLGLIAMSFMPKGVSRLSRKFRQNPFVAPLIGLFMLPMGWLILMVAGTILLAITVVGIPLIFFWWLFGLFVLLLAFPLGAVAVGDLIFNRANRPNPGLGLRLLSLFVIVMLASALWAVAPPLGLIAGLLLSWIGLGAWAFAAFGSKDKPAAPVPPAAEAV